MRKKGEVIAGIGFPTAVDAVRSANKHRKHKFGWRRQYNSEIILRDNNDVSFIYSWRKSVARLRIKRGHFIPTSPPDGAA